MTTETFAHVPLARIVASTTNPRRHFDAAKLAELAESIRTSGVHQPVLLRPLPGARVAETASMDPRPEYELVSGERRYRASQQAGADSIPAMVRALTDDQVLEIQLVENLQRDDLQPLEEAEGYDRLMHAHDPALTAEQIGQRIGKSRSYVYGRLKLLALCPEGQQALREGRIQAAVAEAIARIPDTRVQAQALGNVYNPMTGDAMSVREARALIQRQYMLRLAEAPFPLDQALGHVPFAPACTQCHKRTGADPDLFADTGNADLCLDMACFREKTDWHQSLQVKAARQAGATVIEGREAQQIALQTADGRLDGYMRLDDKRDSPEKGQTLRQIIGGLMEAEGIQPTLIAMPDHEPVAALDTATAQRLLAKLAKAEQEQQLKAQASKGTKAAAQAAAELQARKDHEHYWDTWTWRLMELAWAKISAREDFAYSLPDQVIRLLARNQLPKAQDRAQRLCAFLGLGKVAAAPALAAWVNEHPDPDRALALIMLFNYATTWQEPDTGAYYHNAHFAFAIAEDPFVGVSVQTVKAEVEAEHTAEIRARNKVQADQAPRDPAEASTPLDPAAQPSGGRGTASKGPKAGGKGKKPPAAPAPRLSAGEAMLGIAAAMQGTEAGGDCAPGGADPAVGDAAGVDEGRATSPDAGAALLVPGDRVRLVGDAMAGQFATVQKAHTLPGKWLVVIDGLSAEYVFDTHELELVEPAAHWLYPEEGAAA